MTQKSHAKIDPSLSSGSHNAVGTSLYNLPKEALDDYRNLMQQASHAAHHPSTRESTVLSHHRHADIPHSHPSKTQRKVRQKLLALHLLANQKRQNANKDIPVAKMDPHQTLMCRYLRLSSLNVETLVDMCNEAGVPIGIHPHMSIDDVARFVFDEKLVGSDLLLPGQVTSDEINKETHPAPEQEHVEGTEPSQET